MYRYGLLLAAAFGLALSTPASAQVAILQIQVTEGDGAVHAPGSRSARALAVQVTDETGKPVSGASVSFHLPEDGPGGTFTNGLRTEIAITDGHGQASLHGLQLNRVPGRFPVRIIASREQARAGTVSFQYIAETNSGAASPHQPQARNGKSGSSKKWALLAAVGGGAVAGMLAARSSSSSTPAAPVSTPTPPAPTLAVGTPTITVGKP